MKSKYFTGFILLTALFACNPENNSESNTAFEVFCEMVSSEAKPISLHHPMDPEELSRQWDQLNVIAARYGVSVYREDNFPANLLFPDSLTKGKSVTVIYTGDRLVQYNQWKSDVSSADKNNHEVRLLLARRLGRILGYTPQGINKLLNKNTEYTNIELSGVRGQTTHFYYKNLDIAVDFYRNILGLHQEDSTLFQIGNDSFLRLHKVNESHPVGQPKSTAIALLTDQLPQWYELVQQQGVQIKYTYKPRKGGPHDGFVALDPEGYLLEFEEFKQHPENELLMAALENLPPVSTANSLFFNGSITWTYHRDVLQMQNFYEQVLGFRLVADQGWTKIFQTSDSGFIGLVDERRGMEDYAGEKAVEIEWRIADYESFDEYASEGLKKYMYHNGSFIGPEKYHYHIAESL